MPDERLPDERLSDERLSDERLSDERLSDERLSDERLSDERLSDERLSDERLSDERLSDERLPDERLPDKHRRHRHRSMMFGLLVACGDRADPSAVAGEPGPGAFDPSYAASDGFFTRMAGPVDGESVHGTVQIWYSTNLDPLLGGPFTAPEGTVAIKAQDNGQPALTVMIKEPAGFDPENGDWSYEQRSADGALTNAGALAACIACHSGHPDTDFLAGTELE